MTTPDTIQKEEIWKQLKREGWAIAEETWTCLWNDSLQSKNKQLRDWRETVLYMDLRNIGESVIKLGPTGTQLVAPMVLQVLERRNVSLPQPKQVVQGDEDSSEDNRLHKWKKDEQWVYKLSDGKTTLTAVEEESLVELHQNWKRGIKIAVVQPIAVFHGVVFVTSQSIKVLGGGFGRVTNGMEEKERKPHKEQQNIHNGPPLFQPFNRSMQRSSDVRFAGFDIDAFVKYGELRTIHKIRNSVDTEVGNVGKKQQQKRVYVDERAKNAMLNFLQNLQGKKHPHKPVAHTPKVDNSVVAKESEMSVERGIQRLADAIQEFTIKEEGPREKIRFAEQTDETNKKEAEEIMRSFYTSRQENSNPSRTSRGRGRRQHGRGRTNVKGRGRRGGP